MIVYGIYFWINYSYRQASMSTSMWSRDILARPSSHQRTVHLLTKRTCQNLDGYRSPKESKPDYRMVEIWRTIVTIKLSMGFITDLPKWQLILASQVYLDRCYLYLGGSFSPLDIHTSVTWQPNLELDRSLLYIARLGSK